MLVVGVDVGGTNTDAVVLDLASRKVIAETKEPTTADVTTGVRNALRKVVASAAAAAATPHVLDAAGTRGSSSFASRIAHCHIGSTHCVNALVQRRSLARVACIRIGTNTCSALKPFGLMPKDLARTVCGAIIMDVAGGHNFDCSENSALDEEALRAAFHHRIVSLKLRDVAISAPFSNSNSAHESRAKEILLQEARRAGYAPFRVTLSHEVGGLDLLKRENAAIVNAALRPMAASMCAGLSNAARAAGLSCDVRVTSNDGTLLSLADAARFPVLTVGSGPTNSMRGAAFIAGLHRQEAIVVDIGGTTTDVGLLLSSGYPRLSNVESVVAGCILNSRIPAVTSVGIGGGSIVSAESGAVGPESVGFRIHHEARVFGGSQLTATDIAVAAGLLPSGDSVGDARLVADLDPDFVQRVVEHMSTRIEELILECRLTQDEIPVVLVGGGAILTSPSASFEGASTVLRPTNGGVANAIGAALASIAATSDTIVNLDAVDRDTAIANARAAVQTALSERGADPSTVQIVDEKIVEIALLAGRNARVICRGVAALKHKPAGEDALPPASKTQPCQEASAGQGLAEQRKTADEVAVGDSDTPPSPSSSPLEDDRASDHPGFVLEDSQCRRIDSDGTWHVSHMDLECIALGAGILGCGGGGQTRVGLARAHQALEDGLKIEIQPLGSIPDDACVVSTGGFGAPMILCERIGSGKEEAEALAAVEKASAQRATHVSSIEIGGVNSLLPLLAAAQAKLPVVDADGMGRAFPRVPMYLPFAAGGDSACAVAPVALTNCDGSVHMLYGPEAYQDGKAWNAANVVGPVRSAFDIETAARSSVPALGGVCGIALPPLTGVQARKLLVSGTYTHAFELGRAILKARESGSCPVAAAVEVGGGRVVFRGTVCKPPEMSDGSSGFSAGNVQLSGVGEYEGQVCKLFFQNEFVLAQRVLEEGDGDSKDSSLLAPSSAGSSAGSGEATAATSGKHRLAAAPQLICLVDRETARPIFVDEVKEGFGLRVAVLELPLPKKWYEFPEALKLVQLSQFGVGTE